MGMDLVKGLATTLRELGKKPTTVSYPEQRRQLPSRFRGRHVLHRYENGLERCVGCFLCAGACPADAIYIEADQNTEEQRVSPGERYARVFDINLLRCIFCGYCEQACPTGAITLERIYELSEMNPEDLIYHKQDLLEPLGVATRGSLEDWEPVPPEETPTPLPPRQGFFDGLPASAASVGQGDLPTEQEILLNANIEEAGGGEQPGPLTEPQDDGGARRTDAGTQSGMAKTRSTGEAEELRP